MPSITALEAKTRFGELLDRVSRGEEIVITKHERPVARIVPEGRPSLSRIREAASDLRALRRESVQRRRVPLTDLEVRSAIEKGRR